MKPEYFNLSILQGLSKAEQELLLSMTQELCFNPDELIIRDVDVASDLYILIQGWVSIEMDVAAGETPIETLGTEPVSPLLETIHKMEATVLRSGDPFGEMAFLKGGRRSADVRAVTSVKVLQWDGAKLHEVLESNYRLGYLFMNNLARLLAQRIREINLKWRSYI